MVHTTINLLDLIVFGVLGLSALLSFFRGFVREVLSLGAWVGASIVTLYAFPHVAAMLKPHVANIMVASGFAAMFTFIGALIILSVFSSLFLKFVKSGSDVGLLDNAVGLVFGLARGTLLIAVGWFIFTLVVMEKDYPDWLKGSVSLPYVQQVTSYIAKIAPDYLDDIKDSETKEELKEAVDEASDKPVINSDTDWPSMDDLKNRMNNVTGGGY